MNCAPLVTPRTPTDPDSPNSRRDALRAAVARLGGFCEWGVDPSGWVVTLYLPHERTFAAPTLEAALAACVDWPLSATTSSPRGQFTDRHVARGTR